MTKLQVKINDSVFSRRNHQARKRSLATSWAKWRRPSFLNPSLKVRKAMEIR